MSDHIILKSSDRPKRKRKDLITQAQAEKAAEQLGMVAAKIGGLKNKAAIGKYIEQLGATQIGRSTLLIVQDKAEADLAKIEQFIQQNDGGDLALTMDLYKLKAIYSDVIVRAAQAQMKIKGETTIVQGGAPVIMPFPPGSRIMAQIPEGIPTEHEQGNGG